MPGLTLVDNDDVFSGVENHGHVADGRLEGLPLKLHIGFLEGGDDFVAVLCGGGAAKRLKERDKPIGWESRWIKMSCWVQGICVKERADEIDFPMFIMGDPSDAIAGAGGLVVDARSDSPGCSRGRCGKCG